MRTIIWFIYFWLYQLFSIPSYLRISSIYKNDGPKEAKRLADIKAARWGEKLVKLTGSEVEVIGEENIPKDGAVVFVANHQSNFDIPLLLGYIKKEKGFVSKAEAKRLPVVGSWMKFLNCVFMERTDPRAALKSIKEGIEVVKNGDSLVIFPEGTRSSDGKLNEFKAGSFKLALKSGAPVIPIIINGSIDIMRKGSNKITPAKVQIIVSEPIDPSKYKSTESYLLREEVYDIINSKLA